MDVQTTNAESCVNREAIAVLVMFDHYENIDRSIVRRCHKLVSTTGVAHRFYISRLDYNGQIKIGNPMQ